MFDTRDLLGAMLGSGLGGRNPRMAGFGGRSGGTLGGGGLTGGGLGGMLGGGGLPRGGMMGGMAGGRAGGGMGGMQGALLGVLGGIAVSALQRRMQGAAATRAAPPPAPVPEREAAGPVLGPAARPSPPAATAADATEAGSVAMGEPAAAAEVDEGRARFLVRVMVAAANADMRVDEQERARILGKLDEAGADPGAREFVERELRAPMTLEEIAREVSGPDVAAQAYAAALAAIDVDKATERRFLQALAERTGLDAEIVGEIHDQLGQPRPA
jgi:uncharacterized membrane protein YebE (DUF533 family)